KRKPVVIWQLSVSPVIAQPCPTVLPAKSASQLQPNGMDDWTASLLIHICEHVYACCLPPSPGRRLDWRQGTGHCHAVPSKHRVVRSDSEAWRCGLTSMS